MQRKKSVISFLIIASFFILDLPVGAATYSLKSVVPTLSIAPSSTSFGGVATLSWNIVASLSRRATCRADGPVNWQGPLRTATGSFIVQSSSTQKYSIICTDGSRADATLSVDRNSRNNGVLLYYIQNTPDRKTDDMTSATLAWSYIQQPINRGAKNFVCKLNNVIVANTATKPVTSGGVYTLSCPGRSESINVVLKNPPTIDFHITNPKPTIIKENGKNIETITTDENTNIQLSWTGKDSKDCGLSGRREQLNPNSSWTTQNIRSGELAGFFSGTSGTVAMHPKVYGTEYSMRCDGSGPVSSPVVTVRIVVTDETNTSEILKFKNEAGHQTKDAEESFVFDLVGADTIIGRPTLDPTCMKGAQSLEQLNYGMNKQAYRLRIIPNKETLACTILAKSKNGSASFPFSIRAYVRPNVNFLSNGAAADTLFTTNNGQKITLSWDASTKTPGLYIELKEGTARLFGKTTKTSTSAKGYIDVTPTKDTTYMLTATDSYGITRSLSRSVKVSQGALRYVTVPPKTHLVCRDILPAPVVNGGIGVIVGGAVGGIACGIAAALSWGVAAPAIPACMAGGAAVGAVVGGGGAVINHSKPYQDCKTVIDEPELRKLLTTPVLGTDYGGLASLTFDDTSYFLANNQTDLTIDQGTHAELNWYVEDFLPAGSRVQIYAYNMSGNKLSTLTDSTGNSALDPSGEIQVTPNQATQYRLMMYPQDMLLASVVIRPRPAFESYQIPVDSNETDDAMPQGPTCGGYQAQGIQQARNHRDYCPISDITRYFQKGDQWDNHPYSYKGKDCGRIRDNGCGPTSLAMVIEYYSKKRGALPLKDAVTPASTADAIVDAGSAFYPCSKSCTRTVSNGKTTVTGCGGTVSNLAFTSPKVLGKFYMKGEQLKNPQKDNLAEMKSYLQQGYPLIVRMGGKKMEYSDCRPDAPFTTSTGHIIVLTGYNFGDDTFTTNDPHNYSYCFRSKTGTVERWYQEAPAKEIKKWIRGAYLVTPTIPLPPIH